MIDQLAIIGGTGPEGRGLAARWARAGVKIIIGSRDENRARITARLIAENIPNAAVTGMENAVAAAACDVIVLAVPFEAQAGTLKNLKAAFRPHAVLVTTVVPLATSVGDRGTRTVGVWQGSAAEQAAELAPETVTVVAAFQNISAALLNSAQDLDCDVIVCSDDKHAKEIASELARLLPGVRAIDGGRLENARIVEQLTALLVGINIRYKEHSGGIRITGLPDISRLSS